MTSLEAIGYHNLRYYRSGVLYPSKERVFLLQLSIFFQKHSCLVPVINEQINLMASSGLILKWTDFYLGNKYLYKQKQQPAKKLTLHEISGVFLLCLIFYVFSVIVFIGEMISKKIQRFHVFVRM